MANAFGRIDRIIGQNHQAEFVRQFPDSGEVEVGQKDAFLGVVFHDPPAGRRRA